MLNFIFLVMYTLAGAYAAIDTDALNAQQPFAKFEKKDGPFSHILKINSLKDDSALALYNTQAYTTGQPKERELAIIKVKDSRTLASVVVRVAPLDDVYDCTVSVASFNKELMSTNYANALFVTRSDDLACMNPPQIDISKKDLSSTALEYKLPQDIDGATYYLCVSMFLSNLEEMSLSLIKRTAHLSDKPVFTLIYDKGQITPRQL